MSLQVSRILHAGYQFKTDQGFVLFDPVLQNPFSRNCYAFPDVTFNEAQIEDLTPTAVFISHYHDDHCCLESLNLIKRDTAIYIFCIHDEILDLIKQLGFNSVYSLKLNEVVQLAGLKITAIRSLDENVDSLFHIQYKNLNLLNVVDSWLHPDTFDYLFKIKWDLILWPFQSMRELEVLSPSLAEPANQKIPYEHLDQLKLLKPKYLVPSSCQFIHEEWSWYNKAFFPISYKHFSEQILEILPQTQIIKINPSQSFELNSDSFQQTEPLAWITTKGDQNLDYQYDPNLKAPTAIDVSKKFRKLSAEEQVVVNSFCQQELINKFNQLEQTNEGYFANNLVWKLVLYNNEGHAENFYYKIENNKLSAASDNTKFNWLTELSDFKLFSALISGESLTSMYIRINDFSWPKETLDQLKLVDPIEDPLIRCLFENSLAEYQKNQLKKLTI